MSNGPHPRFDFSSDDQSQYDDVDWWLLRDSCVHRFADPEMLDAVVGELRSIGYLVAEADASGWASVHSFFDFLRSTLAYPAEYGSNLDSLGDFLRGMALYEHGSDSATTGTVLVIRNFGELQRVDARSSHVVLDSWACHARTALLGGHRMIALVELPNEVVLDKVGSMPVLTFRERPSLE